MAIGILLGYMGLLYFGAIIAPGVGLSGHLLVQLPAWLVDWAHAPGYGLLAILLTHGLQRRAWPLGYALMMAGTTAFAFGLFTELRQGSVPGRYSSIGDLLVNAVGIGIAAMVMAIRELRVPLQSGHPTNPTVTSPDSSPTCEISGHG